MAQIIDINGGFENGWTHGKETDVSGGWHTVEGGGAIQEVKVPNGGVRPWFYRWADATVPNPHWDGKDFNLFARPECDALEEHMLPEHERKGGSDPLIRDGNWVVKIQKRSRAFQCELLTRVPEAGKYRFKAWVRPDPVLRYDGSKKVYAWDRAAFIYQVIGDQRGVPIDVSPEEGGKPTWVSWTSATFEASAEMVFGMGFLAPWGLEKGTGFFCDGWTLERLDDQISCEARARAKYNRLYVCLPDSVPVSWAEAAARVCRERDRWTLGYSPDDLGIGCNLGLKTGIVVNPSQIGTGLTQAWFDEHYGGGPGVKMYTIEATSAADLDNKLSIWSPDPTPDPDPDPDPPPATVIKAAFHNQLPWPGQFDLLERTHNAGKPFALVKVAAASLEQIEEGRRRSPSTLWAYRSVDRDNPDWFLNADDYWKALDNSNFKHDFDRAVELGYDIIETPINEIIGTHNPDVVQKVVNFEMAYCEWCRARSRGEVAPGVANPGGGNPDHGWETSLLVPLAHAVIANVGVMMPHTYFPVRPEPNVSEEWMKSLQVQYDYHLRPVLSWLETFADHGVDVDKLRFVFGEGSGCGANVNPEGLPGGYKDMGAGWRRFDALNGDLQRNLGLLVEYEKLCQQYKQIIAWCIFTSGRVKWKHFQFNEGEWPLFADRLLA
jgi:hypothetical protein